MFSVDPVQPPPRPRDPAHEKRLEELLTKVAHIGWHQTWWGQLVIALVAGVAGGFIVHALGAS